MHFNCGELSQPVQVLFPEFWRGHRCQTGLALEAGLFGLFYLRLAPAGVTGSARIANYIEVRRFKRRGHTWWCWIDGDQRPRGPQGPVGLIVVQEVLRPMDDGSSL